MDRRQAGAKGEGDELEITPEMIAAGEDVLLSTLGGAVNTAFWSPRDLALRVLLAAKEVENDQSRHLC